MSNGIQGTAFALDDIDRHQGPNAEFLIRYQLAVADAITQGPERVAEFYPKLLGFISDERNLKIAWDHLRRRGQAPGPNGKTYADYSEKEVWQLLRHLRDQIRGQRYRPAPGKPGRQRKEDGNGYRRIMLLDIEDRVVERAVVQILQPLLDPNFDDRSFGGRPCRGPLSALAAAEALLTIEGRYILVAQDLRNAFDNVLLKRLMQVVRARLPVPDVLALIERIVVTDCRGTPAKRGLKQGGPLSPLLMNLYLDCFLDRPWRKLHPTLPLIRYIDDILLLCLDPQEAANAAQSLEQLCVSAGMTLKYDPAKALCDLANGSEIKWLGHRIKMVDGQLHYLSPALTDEPDSWLSAIRSRLEPLHNQNASPLRAWHLVEGLVSHLGPAYPTADHLATYRAIQFTASELAFEEVPDFKLFQARWQTAHAHWIAQRTFAVQRLSSVRDDSSPASAAVRQPKIVGNANPSPCVLYCDGSCIDGGAGGWAYVVEDAHGQRIKRRSGTLRDTTNQRAEMIAAIKGLEALAGGTEVLLLSDNQVLCNGLTTGLMGWKANHWRCGSVGRTKSLANVDLWQELDLVQSQLKVKVRWIPGHANIPLHDQCDEQAHRMAKAAAKSGQ